MKTQPYSPFPRWMRITGWLFLFAYCSLPVVYRGACTGVGESAFIQFVGWIFTVYAVLVRRDMRLYRYILPLFGIWSVLILLFGEALREIPLSLFWACYALGNFLLLIPTETFLGRYIRARRKSACERIIEEVLTREDACLKAPPGFRFHPVLDELQTTDEPAEKATARVTQAHTELAAIQEQMLEEERTTERRQRAQPS